jgi:hypothetical protein
MNSDNLVVTGKRGHYICSHVSNVSLIHSFAWKSAGRSRQNENNQKELHNKK